VAVEENDLFISEERKNLIDMCTIGAKVFSKGNYVLFKNKEFGKTLFEDRVVLKDSHLGIEGVWSWDREETNNEDFSGYSFGFNSKGLLCTDANVRMVDGGENYDLLVELIVKNCSTVDETIAFLEDELENKAYCWTNLMVAAEDKIAAIEVGKELKVTTCRTWLARSNHHLESGAIETIFDGALGSLVRYESASKGLDNASGIDDIFKLCRGHNPPSNEESICAHGMLHTV